MSKRRTADEITRLTLTAIRSRASRSRTSAARTASPSPPIIAGENVMIRPRSTPVAGVANSRSRSIASRGWWPSFCWTSRCSRTSLKKSSEPRPATRRGELLGRPVPRLPAARVSSPGAVALDPPISPNPARRRAGLGPPDPTAGASIPTLRISEKAHAGFRGGGGICPKGARVNSQGRSPLEPPTPARNPAPKGRQSLQTPA